MKYKLNFSPKVNVSAPPITGARLSELRLRHFSRGSQAFGP